MAPNTAPVDNAAAPAAVPFGKPMRALFPFAPTYRNLNHGSYGTVPQAIHDLRVQALADDEARYEISKRLALPEQGVAARDALLPLLGPGVHRDEIVLVANATTGVNVVLRNLAAHWTAPASGDGDGDGGGGGGGDAVLFLATTYGACHKTLQSLAEAGRLQPVAVPIVLPRDDDDAIVQQLRAAHAAATARGLVVRLALFDTIVSAPGALLPWQRLAAACRELGILSLVDGAHGIGHVDLRGLGAADGPRPDFFVSNCHKWLFVPRGCAVLYVPFRNQHHIATCLPTSWGYEPPALRAVYGTPAGAAALGPRPSVVGAAPATYFADLFADVGTLDYSPWACVPAAVRWRQQVCGGEAAIRAYCVALARRGSEHVAARLGTEVMDNPRSGLRDCAMANVRLPFAVAPDAAVAAGTAAAGAVPLSQFEPLAVWLTRRAAAQYDTYFRITYYEGHAWVRLSAQVYLDDEDFAWAATALLALCDAVKKGEWRSGS